MKLMFAFQEIVALTLVCLKQKKNVENQLVVVEVFSNHVHYLFFKISKQK